jgi:hypothetical protein
MTRRGPIRRSFLLTEVIALLAVGVILLAFLAKFVADAIYLQQLAAQHGNRIAVMDALSHRLRGDALAATNYEYDGTALTLRLANGSGPSEVTYILTPDIVRRTTTSGEETEWESRRLEFVWRIEWGSRADVLLLDFIEVPPPRRTELPPQTFSASFVLPHGLARPTASTGSAP